MSNHISTSTAPFPLIHPSIICTFILTLLLFSSPVILLLSKTYQSLVPSFFQLCFQMKTRLALVLTMTHSSRLPPYPIYSAQCPGQFSACVSSITLLFSSIHPSIVPYLLPVDDQPPTSLHLPLRSLPLLVCIISSVFPSLWAESQPEYSATLLCSVLPCYWSRKSLFQSVEGMNEILWER